MPIDLNRAEKIGGQEVDNAPPKSNLLFGNIEVLTINKVPFNGISFIKDGFYQCPFCRRSAIKQILDYRCHKCESRVIAWQCYATKTEEKHVLYDSYISRFHESCEASIRNLKAKYKKEGKPWPGDKESSPNSYPTI